MKYCLKISVAKNFTYLPGGRTKESGAGSAELFLESHLIPALKLAIRYHFPVFVNLDDISGNYSESFLEESFAGLMRNGFSYEELINHLRIESKNNDLIDHIIELIVQEAKKQNYIK